VSLARFEPELVDFLESGVSLLVGSCDASARPTCMYAAGARVFPDDAQVTVYLVKSLAGRTLADLSENPRLAVTFSRILDHRSLQLKGELVSIEETCDTGKKVQERYLASYGAALLSIGFPDAVAHRLAYWPSVAVTFRTTSLFEQTPGPRAGTLLLA